MVASQRSRVRAIESARAQLMPAWAAELRPTLLSRFGSGRPARELALRLKQGLAGLRYQRDKYDAKTPGNEVVKHPFAVLRQAGADCEDQNVFLAGCAFMVCSPGTKLASVYYPSVDAAAHVALAYLDGARWRVLDLIGGVKECEYDGTGEMLVWR